MATFSYVPSYSTSMRQAPKIIEAKFGDGYEQALFKGINTSPENWQITFTNISSASAQAIVDFFTTNETPVTPFEWTNPNGDAGKYKCRDWNRTYDGYEHNNITCLFEEVFWG